MTNIDINYYPFLITLSEKDGSINQITYQQQILIDHSKLWNICLNHNGEDIRVEPSDLLFTRISRETPFSTTVYWKTAILSVAVRLLLEDGQICFYIHVDCHQNDITIADIQFPILNCMPISEQGKDDYLLLPWQNGWIIKDPVRNLLQREQPLPFWLGRGGKRYENEYPSQLSFQYTALYNESRYGLYFATEDGDARIKTIRYQPAPLGGLSYSVVHYPENMLATQTYTQPYAVVMTIFKGDWQTPTTIYRSWAIQQKWARKRLTDRAMPKQLEQIGLWRINHMNYALGTRTQEYFETTIKLRDVVNAPVGLHWYGWNMGEHDIDYPEYITEAKRLEDWPQQLKCWNQRFAQAGIVKIPYVNARLWDIHTKSWQAENAPAAALVDEIGQLYREPWKNNNLRPMCPATEQWQQKVLEFSTETMEDLGFDGLYLDQIASFNATLCFNPKHPHPQGGGSWWNDSYHTMMRKIRDAVGPNKILTTESCCESYVDCFDQFLILDTNMQGSGFNAIADGENCESVPLFNMIYGGYALCYGSICRFSDPIEIFTFNFIRNILWGFVPTVEGGDESDLNIEAIADYYAILRSGVDFYLSNRELLWHSRLLQLCDIPCDSISIQFKIRQSGVLYYKSYPGVYAVIREDHTGKLCCLGYNFLDRKQSVLLFGRQHIIEPQAFFMIDSESMML